MKRISRIALHCLLYGGLATLGAHAQTAAVTPKIGTAQPKTGTPQPKTEGPPETVLATFRVKPDQLPAFLKMMPEYWKALRDRNLVDAEPHLLLQGEEDGKPVVIQVFTWKSEDIPDHAPPEIRKYWDQMNTMVESRNGKPGIDFPPMKLVDIEPVTHAASR